MKEAEDSFPTKSPSFPFAELTDDPCFVSFGKVEPGFKRSPFYPNTHHDHPPSKYKTSIERQDPNLDLFMPFEDF